MLLSGQFIEVCAEKKGSPIEANGYADDADAADLRRIFFDMIRVDPLHPRHPRIQAP